jgi:hypothetical protein
MVHLKEVLLCVGESTVVQREIIMFIFIEVQKIQFPKFLVFSYCNNSQNAINILLVLCIINCAILFIVFDKSFDVL